MKKYFILSMATGFGGAIAALLVWDSVSLHRLSAQEPTPIPAPGLSRRLPVVDRASAELPPHGRGPAIFNEQGYTPDERVNIAVYENVNRCVVNINTKTTSEALFVFELTSEGAGSGVVLDQQGHVLTNQHVVDGAKQIQVILFDGKNYEAKLIGADEPSDIAVLKIEAPPESLYPVHFGDSTHLLVGQRVFAIGNPFGLERTLTTGIISSLNRTLPTRNKRTMKSIIQIDAAINPGNSGGPLLDAHGRLIGVNTAIASATGQNTGVGFAIPVNSIARVVPQLIAGGRVVRPDAGIAKVFQTEKGLLIATLTQGGPAERAGLRGPKLVKERRRRGPFTYDYQNVDLAAADLIVAVDGNRIKTADEFLSAVESRRPGEETIITVLRDGREQGVALRLAASE